MQHVTFEKNRHVVNVIEGGSLFIPIEKNAVVGQNPGRVFLFWDGDGGWTCLT